MAENIQSINYDDWRNDLKRLAMKCDTDGVKGLQGKEIIDFTSASIEAGNEQSDIMELMGLSIKRTRAAVSSSKSGRTYSDEFNKAREKYNNELNPNERYNITQKTYEIGYEKLHSLEKTIDEAYKVCQVYQDINISVRPMRGYYRFYQNFDELKNFDLEEIRKMTTEDMNSLNELRKNVQKAVDDANGEENPTEVKQTEYDADELAKRFLPIEYNTYEEFTKANSEVIEKFKTADPSSLTPEEHKIYTIAKNYAKEMLKITINEARTARWDTGEQLQAETSKFLDDMWDISNFEYEGITDEGLEKIESGIMFKSFEEALTNNATGISDIKDNQNGIKKVLVNGEVKIHYPDGRVYNTNGQRLK